MQIRTRGGRHKRRIRIAVPAVAAVVAALVGTGLAMSGSQAAETEGPQLGSRQQIDPLSQQELRSRTIEAMKADKASKRTLVQQPSSSSSSETTSAPSARIIGGSTTTISAAPWMAQLHFADSLGNGYFCGGVVVAPTKVATAAHCVKGIKWYETGTVITGTDQLPTELSDGTWDFHGGVLRGAYRQWNHPAYSAATIDNDVAVLTLTSPVSVKPLPIMQNTDTALYTPGTDAKVYGWGRTSSTVTNSASQTLKVADADINSNAACQTAYGSSYIVGHMICAGAAPTGDDSTSETTCNGDSGGPLVAGGKLVGLVSWGDVNCSAVGKYGVYAKVSTYSAPIRARVNDANWSGDHTADLLARRASDSTLFGWTSKVTSLTRQYNHGYFGGVTLMVQADLNRDDYQDLLYRLSNGDVYWAYDPDLAPKLIAKGWGAHKQILVPGDLTGDDLPDMMAVNSSGNAYLYPGKGTGAFAAPVLIGAGWGQYGIVRGHGDFTGDGRADILARGAGGATYLYTGTGKATGTFAARRLVGTFGSSFNALVTTGDVNSDGNADLLVRDTTGKLWLYPGNGKATGGIFATRVAFGTGWQAYNLFG
ncbi:trypsin-like serine protease [Streptomyces sp. NBC_00879]|uniref:trypsin-like serine protease n=1 Tax=Streptomyces sp. NBC_00879 TaxID=2975855 RepID=UPI00386459CE|nr:trypsin-like serine protease [Streptomyces sp. NBC_00879]